MDEAEARYIISSFSDAKSYLTCKKYHGMYLRRDPSINKESYACTIVGNIDSDGVVNVLKFGIGIDLVAEVTKWNTHFLDKFISNKNYIGEGWSLCTEAQFNEAATSFINHFLGIIAKKPD